MRITVTILVWPPSGWRWALSVLDLDQVQSNIASCPSLWWSGQKKASIQLYITKQKICHAFLDSSQRSSNPCSASPRQVSRSIFGALGTAWCEPNTQVSKSPSTVLESLPPYYISGAQIDLELKAQTPALSCIFSGSGLRFDMCQDGWKPGTSKAASQHQWTDYTGSKTVDIKTGETFLSRDNSNAKRKGGSLRRQKLEIWIWGNLGTSLTVKIQASSYQHPVWKWFWLAMYFHPAKKLKVYFLYWNSRQRN